MPAFVGIQAAMLIVDDFEDKEATEPSKEQSMKLRAHHLLCLRDFRGVGYSAQFTSHMAALHKSFHENPAVRVRLVTEPDAICLACPHLDDLGRCGFREGEEEIAGRDRRVLEVLGVFPEEERTWGEWVGAVRSVGLSSFEPICRECFWYPLGLCFQEPAAGPADGSATTNH